VAEETIAAVELAREPVAGCAPGGLELVAHHAVAKRSEHDQEPRCGVGGREVVELPAVGPAGIEQRPRRLWAELVTDLAGGFQRHRVDHASLPIGERAQRCAG
jgi:hypothetical protein